MAMIKCPECGAAISEKAMHCPSCGTPINNSANKKFCQHCGSQIDKDCVVCPRCGKQVADLAQNLTNEKGTRWRTETCLFSSIQFCFSRQCAPPESAFYFYQRI